MTMIKALSLSLLVLLVLSWNATKYNKRRLQEELTAREKRKRRAAEIIADTKPIMHTFVDRNEPAYVDEELLQLWTDAWTKSGWDISILTIEDAQKHPDYETYKQLLDRKRLCCLPRQSYLRHIAMGAIDANGGFYSEPYVFPLHRISDMPDGNEIMNGNLPYNGEFTSYDGIIGSVLSGSKEEWNRITTTLMSTVEKNVALAFQKIYYFDNVTKFNFRSDEMYGNFFFFLQDVCSNSDDKFIIRFHEHDLGNWGFDQYSRAFVAKKWLENFRSLCWTNSNGRKLVKLFNSTTTEA